VTAQSWVHSDLAAYQCGTISWDEFRARIFRARIAAQSWQQVLAYNTRVIDCGDYQLRVVPWDGQP
jgi:hypothetical protein